MTAVLDRPTQTTPRSIGSSTSVTVTVVALLVSLAFWTGRLSDRVDTVQLQVPAVADAARAYTDQDMRQVATQLDDISQRLARIETRLDERTRP